MMYEYSYVIRQHENYNGGLEFDPGFFFFGGAGSRIVRAAL